MLLCFCLLVLVAGSQIEAICNLTADITTLGTSAGWNCTVDMATFCSQTNDTADVQFVCDAQNNLVLLYVVVESRSCWFLTLSAIANQTGSISTEIGYLTYLTVLYVFVVNV
jgi:hypothetical protein